MKLFITSWFVLVYFAGKMIDLHQSKTENLSKIDRADDVNEKNESFESLVCKCKDWNWWLDIWFEDKPSIVIESLWSYSYTSSSYRFKNILFYITNYGNVCLRRYFNWFDQCETNIYIMSFDRLLLQCPRKNQALIYLLWI